MVRSGFHSPLDRVERIRWPKALILIVLILLVGSPVAMAGDLYQYTFQWEHSPKWDNVENYRIWWVERDGGEYLCLEDDPEDDGDDHLTFGCTSVGYVNKATIEAPVGRLCFAVTAVDQDGQESDKSDPVCFEDYNPKLLYLGELPDPPDPPDPPEDPEDPGNQGDEMAITLRDSNSDYSNWSSADRTVQLTNVTEGDLIIVIAYSSLTGISAPDSCSDDDSNSYTLINTPAETEIIFWYAIAGATSATLTITVEYDPVGSTQRGLLAAAFNPGSGYSFKTPEADSDETSSSYVTSRTTSALSCTENNAVFIGMPSNMNNRTYITRTLAGSAPDGTETFTSVKTELWWSFFSSGISSQTASVTVDTNGWLAIFGVIFEVEADSGTTQQATASDGITISETLAKAATLQGSAQDGVAAGESLSNLAGLLGVAADGAVLAEALARILTTSAVIADGAVFSDTALADGTLVLATVADGVSLSDAPDPRADLAALAVDGLTLGETLAATALLLAIAQDGLDLSEVLSGDLAGATQGVALDGLNLSDNATAAGAFLAAASDVLNIGETLSTILIALAAAGDGVDLSDQPTWLTSLAGAIVDGAVFSDAGQAQATITVNVSDGVALAETLAAVMTLTALATDSLVIEDATAHFMAQGQVTVSLTTKKGTITLAIKAGGIGLALN